MLNLRPKFSAISALVVLFALLISVACRGPMTLAGNGGGGGIPFGGGNPNPTTVSPVKNLIVVVMQNSSFDHLFGAYVPPAGQSIDGLRPGVPGFTQVGADGTTVSPFLLTNAFPADLEHGHRFYLGSWNNGLMDGFAKTEGTNNAMGFYDASVSGVQTIWTYATQFALADHYYSSILSSAPGQMLYAISASDNDQPFSTQPLYGPCQQADPAAVALTNPNVGDQLSAQNIGWTWFHGNYGNCGDYVPQQNPFQYFTSTNNSPHLQDLSTFSNLLANNQLPSVSWVQPPPSQSGHPGSSSITAASIWLQGFISQVQHSPAWQQSAIVVIWDEGGGWYDHSPPPQVDTQGLGIRVPMMVISPFAKQGVVVHDLMDHTSILKFIQWNWGLPPLNARNSLAQIGDMRTMFTF